MLRHHAFQLVCTRVRHVVAGPAVAPPRAAIGAAGRELRSRRCPAARRRVHRDARAEADRARPRSSSRRCDRCARPRSSPKAKASSRRSSSRPATTCAPARRSCRSTPSVNRRPCAARRPAAPAPQRTSQYWRAAGQAARVAARGRRDQPPGIRAGAELAATAEAKLGALDAQVREGRVQLGYYRVDGRCRREPSATLRSARATASRPRR